MLDLVATGFNKPPELFEHSMRTQEDITRAAAMFKQDYLAVSQHDAAKPHPAVTVAWPRRQLQHTGDSL